MRTIKLWSRKTILKHKLSVFDFVTKQIVLLKNFKSLIGPFTRLNCTGCPNKHGNSVYFMKMANGCKDVSIMSPQDEQ